MDGGTTWNVNIVSAIQGCMTKVDSYEKIIVDVMICSKHDMPPVSEDGTTLENLLRKRKIRSHHTGRDAIQT